MTINSKSVSVCCRTERTAAPTVEAPLRIDMMTDTTGSLLASALVKDGPLRQFGLMSLFLNQSRLGRSTWNGTARPCLSDRFTETLCEPSPKLVERLLNHKIGDRGDRYRDCRQSSEGLRVIHMRNRERRNNPEMDKVRGKAHLAYPTYNRINQEPRLPM